MATIWGYWQLGSVGMLAWGTAAALPILIHLWSRRRFHREPWAAMTFLIAALRKNARRIYLEQWLLLALRTAIMVLFAVALADPRPAALSAGGTGKTGGKTHIVVVIDGSYSMDCRDDGRPRFAIAQERAKQLVASGQQGDGYTLVLMSQPPRVVIGQPAYDRDDVLSEIDHLQLTHGGANLSAALAQVEAILRQGTERHPRLVHRRVCFFSDLQQATWGEVTSADCRARLDVLERLASLELVDLGQPDEGNLAVSRLEIDSATGAVAVAGSEIQIQTDIQSFAREDKLRQSIEVLVDGQPIAEDRIDCTSGGHATFSARHRFSASGEHVVEVRLGGDILPLDNQRWAVAQVRNAIRVLCVGGRPAETRHVALALAPQKGAAQAIEVVEASENRLLDGDVTEFDCMILCNIGRFTASEAGVLARFVSRGGGLIMFLGDQVQAQNYNELLLESAAQRVLPARLGDMAPTKPYRLDPLDYRHPIVAPFRGFPRAGLLSTPVWKYVRVSPVEGAATALTFDNGDAAIVEKSTGRGKCVLVATAASPDSLDRATDPPTPWTALPTWPSFPPLVHETVRAALAGRGAQQNLVVGDELTGDAPAGATAESVLVTGPGGLSERAPLRSVDDRLQWSYGPVLQSGVYEARMDGRVKRYVVNVNPREGDLTRFDPQLLPPSFRREPLDESEWGDPHPQAGNLSYFRWLLAAVMMLLIAEPCLARQFGKGRG